MRANGVAIKTIRERSGLKAVNIVSSVQRDDVEIDATSYSRIESGKRPGTPAQLVAIAKALGVSIVAITIPDVDVSEKVAS